VVDPRREPEVTIVEMPPRPEPVAAVVPFASPVRHGSNPSFPRVLPDSGVDLFSAVEQYQNNLIRQALARTGGNKNRAAQLLGLNRTTLVEMIRRRGLAT
jgi:DNA-binding NtrC family response regulator